jgi:hypothetical protein
MRSRVTRAQDRTRRSGHAAAQFGGAHIEFAAVHDGDPLDPVTWIVRVGEERVDMRRAVLPARRRERAGPQRRRNPGAKGGGRGRRTSGPPDDGGSAFKTRLAAQYG